MLCYAFFLGFDFLITSQEIGWEEHVWYGLFSVEWDVKPQLNQLGDRKDIHKTCAMYPERFPSGTDVGRKLSGTSNPVYFKNGC